MPRPVGPTLLVVGARRDSLGEAIAREARQGIHIFAEVATAGIATDGQERHEQYALDLRHSQQIVGVLDAVKPDVVVCTAGVNETTSMLSPYLAMKMNDAFHVNVIGVMELLRHFCGAEGSGYWTGDVRRKFVAVSSNSARIARRYSLAYCASKAALSMALRVAARELSGGKTQVWGYEPGLLAGTPMTLQTIAEIGDPTVTDLHRMPGVRPEGLPVVHLARQIVNDVAMYTPALNGVMVPFDAGEQ